MTAQQALELIPQPFRDLVEEDYKKHSTLSENATFKDVHYFLCASFTWSQTEIGSSFYYALSRELYFIVFGKEKFIQ